jgi:hypothetical protein
MPSGTRTIPRIFSQGRLQTVITEKAIIDAACNMLIRAGPVTVGRIPHGPLEAMRTRDQQTSLEPCLRLAMERTKGDRAGPHPTGALGSLGCGLRWCSEATKASSEG